MHRADFDARLFASTQRIRQSQGQLPEMTGIEQAFDRGNISTDEYMHQKGVADRLAAEIEQEVQQIESLASERPEWFLEKLRGFVDRIDALGARTTRASEAPLSSRVEYMKTLLPSLRDTLQARIEGRSARYPLSWALPLAEETIGTLERTLAK